MAELPEKNQYYLDGEDLYWLKTRGNRTREDVLWDEDNYAYVEMGNGLGGTMRVYLPSFTWLRKERDEKKAKRAMESASV